MVPSFQNGDNGNHDQDQNLLDIVSNLRMKAIMRIVFTVNRLGTRIMMALKKHEIASKVGQRLGHKNIFQTV